MKLSAFVVNYGEGSTQDGNMGQGRFFENVFDLSKFVNEGEKGGGNLFWNVVKAALQMEIWAKGDASEMSAALQQDD